MKRYKILFTFVLMTVLLLSFSFIACGTETTKPPVNDDPIVVTDDCRETKTFAFDPRYSGKYIFFGNTRYYDITVKEYAEELVPTVNGEYRISGGGKYSVSFDGCEEDEYTLTYDVSDDREFTLAPGEEYLVKLGRIWDEVRTLETGNGNIFISGVYKGSADDLERADLYGGITDPVSSYTMAWRYDDGDYYATVVNTGDGEETAALSFSDIPHVTVGADGSAETIVDFDGEHCSYICFEDVPAGNYVMTLDPGGMYTVDCRDENMNTVLVGQYSEKFYFDINAEERLYIKVSDVGDIVTDEEKTITLRKDNVSREWVINGVRTYENVYFAKQGETIHFDFLINGVSVDRGYDIPVVSEIYGAQLNIDEKTITLPADCATSYKRALLGITVPTSGESEIASSELCIYCTLAESFEGLDIDVKDNTVTLSWGDIPGLYSFVFKINGILQPEIIVEGKTFMDITKLIPDNADRIIIEMDNIVYQFSEYDSFGNPKTEKVEQKYPADEDMVYIVDL